MTESEDKNELIGKLIANNKYRLTQFIGSGSFSLVYKVKETYGSQELVVKLESIHTKNPQLSHEFRIYQILRHECKHYSIPKTYFFGEFYCHLALVMELLGPTLASKFVECGQRFSVKTVTLLALQMIDIFEYIHSRRVIYRDVKPENYLLGLTQTSNANKLHIIDFGLAKEYKDRNDTHIDYKEGVGMTGTARYMSINTHLHKEQSRRDDMEAIGYLLIYLLRGDLPWMGLDINSADKRVEKIGEVKLKTTPEVLCNGLPQEFCDYLKAVRLLTFTEEPDYQRFKAMFENLLTNKGEKIDFIYDWNEQGCLNDNKKMSPKSLSMNTLKETNV